MSFGADRFIVSKTSKNGRRTFSTVYTPTQYLNWTILEIFLVIVLVIAFAPLVGVIALIAYPFTRHDLTGRFIGMGVSAYIVLDLYKEWILYFLYKAFASPTEYALIKYGNAAVLASLITFSIFDELFYYLAVKSEMLLFLYVCALTFLFYAIALNIF